MYLISQQLISVVGCNFPCAVIIFHVHCCNCVYCCDLQCNCIIVWAMLLLIVTGLLSRGQGPEGPVPATLTQGFLGFPVSMSKCWDGTQDVKLPLHASHVVPPRPKSSSKSCIYVNYYCHRVTTQLQLNKYYYYPSLLPSPVRHRVLLRFNWTVSQLVTVWSGVYQIFITRQSRHAHGQRIIHTVHYPRCPSEMYLQSMQTVFKIYCGFKTIDWHSLTLLLRINLPSKCMFTAVTVKKIN